MNLSEDQLILQERARKNAVLKKEQSLKEESLLVVEFLLIPEKYCVVSSFVTEVLPLKEITLIPGAPSFILGVINVRGRIISVVNLKIFFNLKMTGLTELNKIIIVKQHQMEFGIVTDAITGTHEIPLSSISAPPTMINGIGFEYIKGVTSDGLILLDMPAILSSNSLIVNQK